MEDVAYAETRLRESGLLDGLNEASAFETAVLKKTYREWALRLAPYLRDGKTDVATALQLYRLDNAGGRHHR